MSVRSCCRAFGVAAGEAAVVVAVGQAGPALLLLALDVRLTRLALGIEAVELLLQSFLRRLARVDGAADQGQRPRGCARSVHGFAPWLRQPLKSDSARGSPP